MRKFHALKVASLRRETADSLRLELALPEDLRDEFDFLPGQHLPIEAEIDGERVRRTYSICSVPGKSRLELGIRLQEGGKFSGFVGSTVDVGSELQVMPPFGRFHASIDPAAAKRYVAFAAGSGITPILSIIRTTLEREPGSEFGLYYGNRRQDTTMFIDELFALKNRYPERLRLNFLFTREEQEFAVRSGRLDGDKVAELHAAFGANRLPDEAFVCGPDTMVDDVRGALCDLGMDRAQVHIERYGAPRRAPAPVESERSAHDCEVTVVMDGHKKTFDMPSAGSTILDAAAERGIELPFSCKGGVCATCRTHVQSGEVRMATNYGLESWEVEAGFVLACQSHPVSDRVTLDYDKI